jgi:phospholipase C
MRVRAEAFAAIFVLGAALAACGGSRTASFTPGPSTPGAQNVPLSVRVRLPASFAGTTLSATITAEGGRAPSASASVGLASAACAVSGGERLCTLDAKAPVGLVDVAVTAAAARGGAGLSGIAPRQSIPAGGTTLSMAFDGRASAWSITPAIVAGPADGNAHEVPFAVVALDAQGYTLLSGIPRDPVAVSVSGDAPRDIRISAQGANTFVAAYDGHAVGNVTLKASAAGASAATAPFASLVVTPGELEIPAGASVPITAQLAHYGGAFTASVRDGNCVVTPESVTPAKPGELVRFAARLKGGGAGSCSIAVGPNEFTVPIAIPGRKGVAKVGIGVGSKIAHVVVIFQENRSFDNIFGGLDQNGKPFPGADTVSNPLPGEPTPSDHNGNPVTMQVGVLEECYDPYHTHPNSVTDVDSGKMNGFDKESVVQESCAPTAAPTDYVYRTMAVTNSEVGPYWAMGEQYAISDRMFEPVSSGSYGPHLYLVAAQSANTIDNPSAGFWGCDNTSATATVPVENQATGGEIAGVFPCFTVPTLADVMDRRGVSWRFYEPEGPPGQPNPDFGYDWAAYDSFSQIRFGPDWNTNIVNPPAQIITDVQNGSLAAVTWVTPTNDTSDHPQAHTNMGPAWVASVVNAIGQSQFWDSTAIFITWDDWGGWYDHAPPPVTNQWFNLGIRVPLILVSPYAKAGYVSHVTHTTGSITHFAEEIFGLDSLGEDDVTEDDMTDMFNFNQAPIPFTPFYYSQSKAAVMRAATMSKPHEERERRAGD